MSFSKFTCIILVKVLWLTFKWIKLEALTQKWHSLRNTKNKYNFIISFYHDYKQLCSDILQTFMHWNCSVALFDKRVLFTYFDPKQSQSSSKSHPMLLNNVAGRVEQIITGTHKLPYFKHEITLGGLYICKRGVVLFFLFCFANVFYMFQACVAHDHAYVL